MTKLEKQILTFLLNCQTTVDKGVFERKDALTLLEQLETAPISEDSHD